MADLVEQPTVMLVAFPINPCSTDELQRLWHDHCGTWHVNGKHHELGMICVLRMPCTTMPHTCRQDKKITSVPANKAD